MSDIKLVLSDVDGTLVQLQKHEVSEAVREAVIAAENAGVEVVPVTGRPFEMGQPVFEVLGFDGHCVVDNGASIHEVTTGKLVWSCWLDVETIRQIVAILLPHSTSMDYAVKWEEHVPDPAVEMSLVKDAAPYVFSFLPKDAMPEVEAALAKIPNITISVDGHSTDRSLMAIQVTNIQASKFHGVEALRELNNTKLEHTMAIGDGNNDLPLFQNAGLKIAMGNATDLLKAQADHIVGTIDEDGFAEAINRFVLS